MATFTPEVTTVTRTKIVPKCYDTITKGSPLLMTILQNAKEWATGTKFEFPIQYQDTTNGGNTGVADVLDSDRQNTRVTASFEPKMCYKPVVVADLETTLNQGDERIINLFDIEFDTQAKSIARLMAQNMYTGTGVGNAWDSLYGAADDATNVATYGGLARGTYTSWKGYYLASAGALTLNKMATAYDAVEAGMDSPDIISTTKSLWSKYEALLTPTTRNNYTTSGYPRMNAFGMIPGMAPSAGANAGFNVLFFRGTPIAKDEACPSGKMFMVNTKYFGFKGITLKSDAQGRKYETLNFKRSGTDETPKGTIGNVPSTKGFQFRALMSPVDQLAEVGYLLYAGNFISENPRLQGQMTGLS